MLCLVFDQRRCRRGRTSSLLLGGLLLCSGINDAFAWVGPIPWLITLGAGLPPVNDAEIPRNRPNSAWVSQDYSLFIAASSALLLALGALLLWRQKRLALLQASELRSLASSLQRSQEALRQSEERFRRAFEEGPVGIILASPKSLVLRANRTLCDMLGYSEEELLGLGLIDLAHPEDSPQLLRTAEQLFSHELTRYQLQQRFVRHDKAIIWTKITASLLTNAENRSLYALAIVEDITEQKRAEHTLEENERRFRTLIEKSSDALSLFDAQGRFLWDANSATHRHLGYSPEELVGRSAFDFLHPTTGKPWRCPSTMAFPTRSECHSRLPATLKNRRISLDGIHGHKSIG